MSPGGDQTILCSNEGHMLTRKKFRPALVTAIMSNSCPLLYLLSSLTHCDSNPVGGENNIEGVSDNFINCIWVNFLPMGRFLKS